MKLLKKLKEIKEKTEEIKMDNLFIPTGECISRREPTFVEKMEFVHKNLDEYRMTPLTGEEIEILDALIEGMEQS